MPAPNHHLDVKCRLTDEHFGLFDLIKGSRNRSKLLLQLAMVGLHVAKQSENGAPTHPSPKPKPSAPKPNVAFHADGEGF